MAYLEIDQTGINIVRPVPNKTAGSDSGTFMDRHWNFTKTSAENNIKMTAALAATEKSPKEEGCVACTRFRRHRVRCFDGTGGESWKGGSLHASSSLRRCG